MSKNVHLIVAIDRHGGIGRGGDQPFYIKEDLRHFKNLTTGHTVVMGRKTFEALPRGPLPNRRNIVISRQQGLSYERADVFSSLNQALESAEGEVFIIGGAQIYSQALTLADILHITLIDAVAEDADTFFPAIDLDKYKITSIEPCSSTPSCKFVELKKKS